MEHYRKAQFYRRQAADCRKQAAAAVTPPAARDQWLSLAKQYDELARQAMGLSTVKEDEPPDLPERR